MVLWMLLAVVLLLFAACCYYLLQSRRLTVTHYEINEPLPKPLRIVQLSDLHSAEFGEGNRDLVTLVAEQEPDLIAMTGDMFSRMDEDCHVVTELITSLSTIAPVYYGLGNHETTWLNAPDEPLKDLFARAGATVLECEYVDVDINGVPLRIGGFSGFYGFTHMSGETQGQKVLEQRFFNSFTKTDRYKVLLNHIPTQWLDWHHIDDWHQDLILCGHYHGGQVRIPLLNQGLIAPYVGFWPKYTKGCFVGKTATCVLSAGLGNEYPFIPRFNNPPEIVVADLLPDGSTS